MKYFPFENIIYETRLKPEEIIRRIDEIIEPKKIFRRTGIFASSHKPYEGSSYENTFAIRRIPNYQNSFLPEISGVIHKELTGTTIKVKMKLNIVVLVFISIWLGIAAIVCLAFLIPMFSGEAFHSAMLIPYGMFAFGYLMTLLGFKFESNKSKKYLAQLFEAEIREQKGFK